MKCKSKNGKTISQYVLSGGKDREYFLKARIFENIFSKTLAFPFARQASGLTPFILPTTRLSERTDCRSLEPTARAGARKR